MQGITFAAFFAFNADGNWKQIVAGATVNVLEMNKTHTLVSTEDGLFGMLENGNVDLIGAKPGYFTATN